MQEAMPALYPVQDLEIHEISSVFPEIVGERFDELCRSIAEHGLLHPITTWNGKIIDGRNRYRACKALGRPLYVSDVVPFRGEIEDARNLAIAENMMRRDLTPQQRAMAAEKLANAGEGGAHVGVTSIARAAKLMGCGELSVKQARRIRKTAAPHITTMVEKSELMLAPALRIAALPMEIQNGLRTAKACLAYLDSDEYRTADAGTLTRRFRDAGKALDRIRELDVAGIFAAGLTAAQATQMLAICDNGLELFAAVSAEIRGDNDGQS